MHSGCLFLSLFVFLLLNSNPAFGQGTCTCDLPSLTCSCCVQVNVPGLNNNFCAVVSFNVCEQVAAVTISYNGGTITSVSVDVSQITITPVSVNILSICNANFEITGIIVTEKYVQFTPAVVLCPGTLIQATYSFPQATIGTPSVCIGINDCADCTAQSVCGWCNELGSCLDGDANGNACKRCSLCGWNYGQCDNSQTCLSKSSACGFCSTNNLCIAGDPYGPAIGKCSLDSWDYLTCDQRTGEYVSIKQAKQNYAVLGTSLFFSGLALGIFMVLGTQFYRKRGGKFNVPCKKIHFSLKKNQWQPLVEITLCPAIEGINYKKSNPKGSFFIKIHILYYYNEY